LRISVSAAHTEADVDAILSRFKALKDNGPQILADMMGRMQAAS
jgi:hypothetical protein